MFWTSNISIFILLITAFEMQDVRTFQKKSQKFESVYCTPETNIINIRLYTNHTYTL